MRYEFIHFKVIAEKPKTFVWQCCTNSSGDELGIVKWYGPWRQYCYFPTSPAVYSEGCLRDIYSFLELIRTKSPKDKDHELEVK